MLASSKNLTLAAAAMAATLLILTPGTSAAPLTKRASTTFVSFNKDFTQTTSGGIIIQDQVQVYYDLDRVLPLCNATLSTPNVIVQAFYSINSNTRSIPLLNTYVSPTYNPDSFIVPAGSGYGDLSFWFSCSNNGSAPAYDSNYGANFKFPVSGTYVQFNKGFTSEIKGGKFVAGQPVGIVYDPLRSPCKENPVDPVQSITAYWTNSKGSTGSSLVYIAQYFFHTGLVKTSYAVTVPAYQVTEGNLAVYFSCKTSLESGWDSNYGNNWVFSVAKA
ncbi:hypothetical protein HDU96_003772 [Phlyctochytrium bullatum]|nr:hypothetical protein HDU96_003772 [Phlyctochytrium bullatum]